MWFLKILISLLLLCDEYQSKDIHSINATHCEYTKKRRIAGKKIQENVTSVVTFIETNKDNKLTIGKRMEVKTIMKPAIETIKRVDCCPGYKPGPKKSCLPKCDQFCENGICSAPNECSCNEGFKKLSPSRCIPYCESCERGRCVGPNICECYHGYHKNDTGQCVPTCKEPCVNGWCSEPDVCSCHQGYELDKTDQYKCSPNCTSPCIQGRCAAPDECDCYPGYEFKNGSKTECLPICDFCESGNCTGPSKCTCWDNYEEQEIKQGTNIVKICQPKCIDECINGTCIEVDTCSCKDGYDFVKDSFNVCEPLCDPPCLHGDCVEPNVCSCDPGFENIDGQCQAHCDNECINGFCVHPNKCECMKGYVFTANSPNVCEALCENCPNGMCTEPNICKCSDGFQMTEGNVCEKMCLPECIFGECVNGTCICDNGYLFIDGICTDINTIEWTETYVATTTTTDSFELENALATTTTTTTESFDELEVAIATAKTTTTTEGDVECLCENENCVGENNCQQLSCGISREGCINGTCVLGECKCFDGFQSYQSSPYVCVLVQMTSIESASVKGNITNFVSIIVGLLIVALTAMTLILLLNRRKVNYNVDEKERKVGVHGADYVHYMINKDDHAFA